MRPQQGTPDDSSVLRRKPGNKKQRRTRQENRDQTNRTHPSQSLHERRQLLRIEELEDEMYDDDGNR